MSFFTVGYDTEPLHSRARLHIMVLLSSVTEADFTGIRDELKISDGQLSQQLAKLSDLGLIEVNRSLFGKKSRTVVRLSQAGATVLSRYMQDMQKLLKQVPDNIGS